MTIPPFPVQDLAKLVLGYLAEEQLMTAYDEFLQASPYLDAFRNEYDRIFMTSLKNILAEYRAVKIYVETCKPYTLRKHLFGCRNLLEVVKFLIENVDINKISSQNRSTERSRGWSTNNTIQPESAQSDASQSQNSQLPSINQEQTTVNDDKNHCSACTALQLPFCACKNRYKVHTVVTNNDSNLDSCEATALEDDSGTYESTRKRQARVSDKAKLAHTTLDETTKQDTFETTCVQNNESINQNLQQQNVSESNYAVDTATESAQKIEDFNDVLKVVCNKNKKLSHNSTTGTFQDFATGVGGGENETMQSPSCNNSTNTHVLPIAPKLPGKVGTITTNSVKGVTHIFLNVGNQSKNQLVDTNSPNTSRIPKVLKQLDPKPNDRITILSNVKVDQANSDSLNVPPVLKNATSTPMVQMERIFINGTAAYKATPQANPFARHNYTKDEIMAMPTIILVPTTAPPQVPPNIHKTTIARDSGFSTCTISSETQPLGPLVIDVPSNSPTASNSKPSENTVQETNQDKEKNTEMLMKTIDLKNASAPKDIEGENKNTPQVQPPLRKSSSTPRRTSHVRVLDFTTPRRILQETINEHPVDENGEPIEVIVSKSPSLHSFVQSASKGDNSTSIISETKKTNNISNTSGSSKENEGTSTVILKKVVPVKNYNWDADLRALVGAEVAETPKPKPKSTKKKKLPNSEKPAEQKEEVKVNEKKKSNKKIKAKQKIEEIEESVVIVDDTPSMPVKPNINIISNDWNTHENDKVTNKSQIDKETDTPEMERISLQNALGVKLNISELLETPYKQAIYDIQMDTPRFLGPDIPDEPLSDIKIMNIPTPRFLNTPKPSSHTPSSYSSRPTDYSSGGSYYKPDDQDYIPVNLEYPTTNSVSDDSKTKVDETIIEKQKQPKEKCNTVKSRPVRKCTKNVSYYNSPMVKPKDDGKVESNSSCSDSVTTLSPNHKVTDSDSKPKEPKAKTRSKSEIKRKSITNNKRKTPVKRETPKSFMKIKPRKPTPSKDSHSRFKKRTPDSISKRRSGKEKNIGATPLVVSAPTKSRRKSSTPRKLHCTKTFNSESSGHNSPEIASASKETRARESSVSVAQDSDTEQLRLHWSDDGSQDSKMTADPGNNSNQEIEDITKIKEYIKTTETIFKCTTGSDLHIDLVKRGFDIETARIIERDLLDAPPVAAPITNIKTVQLQETTAQVVTLSEPTTVVATVSTTNIQTVENTAGNEDDDESDIEFSVSECNEESENYFSCVHNDSIETPIKELPKLKDKFSMEVCIDDELTVRLRATPFTVLFDREPLVTESLEAMYKETELAVKSITNIDRLYTPLKDPRAQCYEIFDSTLTSLDTPLKATSPVRKECAAEITLEVEKIEVKEKTEIKKRKRLHSSEAEDGNENKKSKPETQYLLTSTNIQNIDIETVLSKLHGP